MSEFNCCSLYCEYCTAAYVKVHSCPLYRRKLAPISRVDTPPSIYKTTAAFVPVDLLLFLYWRKLQPMSPVDLLLSLNWRKPQPMSPVDPLLFLYWRKPQPMSPVDLLLSIYWRKPQPMSPVGLLLSLYWRKPQPMSQWICCSFYIGESCSLCPQWIPCSL